MVKLGYSHKQELKELLETVYNHMESLKVSLQPSTKQTQLNKMRKGAMINAVNSFYEKTGIQKRTRQNYNNFIPKKSEEEGCLNIEALFQKTPETNINYFVTCLTDLLNDFSMSFLFVEKMQDRQIRGFIDFLDFSLIQGKTYMDLLKEYSGEDKKEYSSDEKRVAEHFFLKRSIPVKVNLSEEEIEKIDAKIRKHKEETENKLKKGGLIMREEKHGRKKIVYKTP